MIKHCAHCGIDVAGKYCSECGQEIGEKDSTLWSIISDTFMNLIDLDRSVFAAVWLVIKSPRTIIESYWKGNRKLYASPGKIMLYALAIAAIHLTNVNQDILGGAVSANFNDEQVGETHIIFWVIFLPFLVLSSYLAFIPKKLSFAKHFVSILYISTSFFIVLTVVQDIFLLATGFDIFFNFGITLFVVLVFIWNATVIRYKDGYGKILLGILMQILILVGIFVSLTLLFAQINSEDPRIR